MPTNKPARQLWRTAPPRTHSGVLTFYWENSCTPAKRKESNERLIARKGMIGKGIGFAPMVVLFVGYLIVPLVFIGMTSMNTSMNSLSTK